MTDFKTILEDLGYVLHDRGKEWRAKPIFRESDNETALRIAKADGRWIDFARGNGGDFKKLVEISGGKFVGEIEKPKAERRVDSEEIFDKNDVDQIVQDHKYWKSRGISEDVLSLFRGGIIPKNTTSSMYGRYVFPIPNVRDEIIGLSGRWVGNKINTNTPKWKHLGSVDSWVYPAFLNKTDILERKEIILVESIGDGLSLWQAGIKNFLVLFGLSVGRAMIKSLIAADPNKIIIATNNDENKNFAGNMASLKIKKCLMEFFDESQLSIKLPVSKKDWGESSSDEILKALR